MATIQKVLVVDDHPMVRDGIRMHLSSQRDLKICGEAATEDEAMALVKQTVPDLVLIDISLRSGHGIELIKQIKARYPAVKMLVLSSYQETLYAERALRAGALGYLNKQESYEKLLEAIRTALEGKRYVSSEITQRLVDQALGNAADSQTPINRLTNRELEILQLIGEGLSAAAIANRLFLSSHTIDTHRENLKRKLNVKDAGELSRMAVRWVLENG